MDMEAYYSHKISCRDRYVLREKEEIVESNAVNGQIADEAEIQRKEKGYQTHQTAQNIATIMNKVSPISQDGTRSKQERKQDKPRVPSRVTRPSRNNHEMPSGRVDRIIFQTPHEGSPQPRNQRQPITSPMLHLLSGSVCRQPLRSSSAASTSWPSLSSLSEWRPAPLARSP